MSPSKPFSSALHHQLITFTPSSTSFNLHTPNFTFCPSFIIILTLTAPLLTIILRHKQQPLFLSTTTCFIITNPAPHVQLLQRIIIMQLLHPSSTPPSSPSQHHQPHLQPTTSSAAHLFINHLLPRTATHQATKQRKNHPTTTAPSQHQQPAQPHLSSASQQLTPPTNHPQAIFSPFTHHLHHPADQFCRTTTRNQSSRTSFINHQSTAHHASKPSSTPHRPTATSTSTFIIPPAPHFIILLTYSQQQPPLPSSASQSQLFSFSSRCQPSASANQASSSTFCQELLRIIQPALFTSSPSDQTNAAPSSTNPTSSLHNTTFFLSLRPTAQHLHCSQHQPPFISNPSFHHQRQHHQKATTAHHHPRPHQFSHISLTPTTPHTHLFFF